MAEFYLDMYVETASFLFVLNSNTANIQLKKIQIQVQIQFLKIQSRKFRSYRK